MPVSKLNNPGPAYFDAFGQSEGTTVAIGTPGDDTVMLNKGYVYLFGPVDGDGDGLSDAWELSYWPTTAGHGPADDYDHDGYSELLELALGLNPTLPNPGGLPLITREGGYLTMRIVKRPGATYELQTAGTLLPGRLDSFTPASTVILTDNSTIFKAQDSVPVGDAPRRYIRLKVTAAP